MSIDTQDLLDQAEREWLGKVPTKGIAIPARPIAPPRPSTLSEPDDHLRPWRDE